MKRPLRVTSRGEPRRFRELGAEQRYFVRLCSNEKIEEIKRQEEREGTGR